MDDDIIDLADAYTYLATGITAAMGVTGDDGSEDALVLIDGWYRPAGDDPDESRPTPIKLLLTPLAFVELNRLLTAFIDTQANWLAGLTGMDIDTARRAFAGTDEDAVNEAATKTMRDAEWRKATGTDG